MRRLTFVMGFLLLLGGGVLVVDAQSVEARYLVLVVGDDGTGLIRAIDPLNPTQVEDLFNVPLSAGESIHDAYLSPTGEWILLRLGGPEGRAFRIYELATGEVFDAISNFVAVPVPPTLNSLPQDVSWSPDGRFFAVRHSDDKTDAQGIYLYDIQTRTLSDLTPLNVNHVGLAWSNDSTRLATVGFECDLNHCSRVTLDVFDAVTASLVESVDLSDFSRGPGAQYTNFCQLQWSPEDSAVAFVRDCDDSLLNSDQEVYIIEIHHQAVRQATHFYPTDINPNELLFQASYDLAWVDDDTLLIGAVVQKAVLLGAPGPLTEQTLIYRRNSDTLESVMESSTRGWVRANSGLYGYIRHSYPQNPVYGDGPLDATVEIAGFEGTAFEVSVTGPNGCPLRWNAAGTILAYPGHPFRASSNCGMNTDTIHFIDVTSGMVTSYQRDGRPMVVLGWTNMD